MNNWAYSIIFIIIFGVIVYLSNVYAESFGKDQAFISNLVGISFELVGFIIMLVGSKKTVNLNLKPAKEDEPGISIINPQVFNIGILLVALGLIAQLSAMLCPNPSLNC